MADFETIGGSIHPDAPVEPLKGAQEEVSKAVERETDAFIKRMEGEPPAPEPAPEPEPEPPKEAAETKPETPEGKIPPPMEERIKEIMGRYEGDYGKMAADLATVEEKRRNAQSRGMRSEHELDQARKEIDDLKAQMAALLTSRADTTASQYGEPTGATGSSPQAKPQGSEWDWSDPASSIRNITSQVVQEHYIALEQAKMRQSEAERLREVKRQNEEDIKRLNPLMTRLFYEDESIYEGKPGSTVVSHLLKRAREVEAATKAAQFYHEIQTQGLGTGETPAGAPSPTTGSLPTNGTSTRATTPERGSTNWSDTKAMKNLWTSRMESIDEDRAIADVLKERGQGEHIKIG